MHSHHYQNVHATGWCSSPFYSREAAMKSPALQASFYHPQSEGPVVARVRVKLRPITEVHIPTRYARDALARKVFSSGRLAAMPFTADQQARLEDQLAAAGSKVYLRLTEPRLKALLDDARLRASLAPTKQLRDVAARTVHHLQTLPASKTYRSPYPFDL